MNALLERIQQLRLMADGVETERCNQWRDACPTRAWCQGVKHACDEIWRALEFSPAGQPRFIIGQVVVVTKPGPHEGELRLIAEVGAPQPILYLKVRSNALPEMWLASDVKPYETP